MPKNIDFGTAGAAFDDWSDVTWRCLAPALSWYSGFNRLEGYDLNNWSPDEWKWLVDWSLLHKCNAWAVCMCGYWPFTLLEYPESVLDVTSDFFNPLTGKKESRHFVHPNIKHEFYPEVIRYAQERGIKMYAYTAINSFVGGYLLHHPDAGAGGAYVKLLGRDRVASLGGRGGACTSAMRRIASINNNWEPGSMGTGVDWERGCHRRLFEAGGSGSLGYILEWRLSEVFAYLASQYLWRDSGVPDINNDDQIGFLDYAYQVHYGDRVGGASGPGA